MRRSTSSRTDCQGVTGEFFIIEIIRVRGSRWAQLICEFVTARSGLAWCVQENNLEEYRKALRVTHTLWGGQFNPVIPLGDAELARSLVRVFRVDCLYCMGRSGEGDALLADFKHLFWPTYHKELFIKEPRGAVPTFLDVYHPARHFYESHVKDRERPTANGMLIRWVPTDRLADVLLATYGAYPAKDDIGIDYEVLFQKYLVAHEVNVTEDGALPQGAYKEITPWALTQFDLDPDHVAWGRDDPGLYYGDSRDFTDLVNFWNLRASRIQVLFYDPECHVRLHEMTDHYLGVLRKRPKNPTGWQDWVTIWNKSLDTNIDLTSFGTGLIRSAEDMVQATHDIYFDPRPKSPPQPPGATPEPEPVPPTD